MAHTRDDAAPPHPPHILRFSTDDLPQRDRIAYSREVYGRTLCGVEIESGAGVPFHTTQFLTILPDLCLSTGDFSPHKMSRPRSLIADGNDDLILYWSTDAPCIATQFGREVDLTPGHAVAWSTSDTGVSHFETTHSFTTFRMARRLLKAAVPNIEDLVARPIASDTTALRLLKGYLNIWQNGELAATAREQQALSDHVYDLIALMFGAKGDAAEQAVQGGGRAARLAQIQREIQRGALDPDFSLPALARRIGVSARYVQQLLEQRNSSFVREMIERRLTLAHEMLRSPQHRRQSIADIAHACGFGADAHFYRQFRRRFDATPNEVRAARGGEGGG